ncbi:MAG: hypothetical protein M3276_07675 [Actinomycetota bacterium]|nr:hypothetical protein [Actinomycetota bacterium]
MTRPRMIAGIAIAGVLAVALLGVLIQRSRDTAYNSADAPVQTPAIVSPPNGPKPTRHRARTG